MSFTKSRDFPPFFDNVGVGKTPRVPSRSVDLGPGGFTGSRERRRNTQSPLLMLRACTPFGFFNTFYSVHCAVRIKRRSSPEPPIFPNTSSGPCTWYPGRKLAPRWKTRFAGDYPDPVEPGREGAPVPRCGRLSIGSAGFPDPPGLR